MSQKVEMSTLPQLQAQNRSLASAGMPPEALFSMSDGGGCNCSEEGFYLMLSTD